MYKDYLPTCRGVPVLLWMEGREEARGILAKSSDPAGGEGKARSKPNKRPGADYHTDLRTKI